MTKYALSWKPLVGDNRVQIAVHISEKNDTKWKDIVVEDEPLVTVSLSETALFLENCDLRNSDA